MGVGEHPEAAPFTRALLRAGRLLVVPRWDAGIHMKFYGEFMFQNPDWGLIQFNGNSRILKWRYVSTIFLAIFCGDIPLHRPYIYRPYIWNRHLQSIGSWNGHWSITYVYFYIDGCYVFLKDWGLKIGEHRRFRYDFMGIWPSEMGRWTTWWQICGIQWGCKVCYNGDIMGTICIYIFTGWWFGTWILFSIIYGMG